MSTSRESVSTVVILFHLEVRVNDAAQEVRAKVSAGIRGDLPRGIEEPIIQKLDFASFPVASLALRSESLSPRDLTTLVDKKIKKRFENISGVGKIDLVGQAKREVKVDIDPLRLEALGMGVDESHRRVAVGEREHPPRAAELGAAPSTPCAFRENPTRWSSSNAWSSPGGEDGPSPWRRSRK
jgi:multidrug efflux pump subunit AcrB